MTPNGTDPDSTTESPAESMPENDLSAAVGRLPDTHSVEFTMKIRGGAYDRLEVDNFMRELAEAIADVRSAASVAGQELSSLRAANARLRSGSGAESEDEITSGAVGLLTQAQLIADKAIADAEQYARDLVLTARNQYREILERAESTASKASATLPAHPNGAPAVPEIEYVRTYAQVAQIQLRSVLDALTEQVDRLGSLPQPADEEDGQPELEVGPTGEPEWQPSPAVQQGQAERA
ncbi:DivIVA domain-containing protein [Agromyces sp. M3QZ16-3]|uniref:DivIVA domain-containing protein n=1 Tax=Agromyces sp. M3QZ16-3 TaxID=3447585 RepID=UPI003F68D9EA